MVSWGTMLNEAQNELILGKWWQLAAAGAAMAVLVTAFSLFTDALRDALDPKLKWHGRTAMDDDHDLLERRAIRVREPLACVPASTSTRPSKRSRAISFDIPANTHRRAGRRIRQRQVRHLAGDPRPAAAGELDRRPGSRILYGGRNLLELSRDELRDLRGRDISMIFQEPMTFAEPGVHRRLPDRRSAAPAHGARPRARRATRAIELLDEVGIPEPERSVDELSRRSSRAASSSA